MFLKLGPDKIHTWINKINGDFASVFYNPKTNNIIAMRDPFGIKPLYFATNQFNNIIGFSSLKSCLLDLVNLNKITENRVVKQNVNGEQLKIFK